MSPADFAVRLLAYCSASRGSVTSWGRTLKHNKKKKGSPTSYHLIWLGADVVYDDLLGEKHRKLFAKRLGLKIWVEPDHDHIHPLD